MDATEIAGLKADQRELHAEGMALLDKAQAEQRNLSDAEKAKAEKAFVKARDLGERRGGSPPGRGGRRPPFRIWRDPPRGGRTGWSSPRQP
jgi:hypothetical protein